MQNEKLLQKLVRVTKWVGLYSTTQCVKILKYLKYDITEGL